MNQAAWFICAVPFVLVLLLVWWDPAHLRGSVVPAEPEPEPGTQVRHLMETRGCGTCGVPAGRWCITKDGRSYLGDFVHKARRVASAA